MVMNIQGFVTDCVITDMIKFNGEFFPNYCMSYVCMYAHTYIGRNSLLLCCILVQILA